MKKRKFLNKTIFLILFLITISNSSFTQSTHKSDDEAIKDLISGFSIEFETYLQEVVQLTGKEILRFEAVGLNSVHKKIEILGNHFDFGYLMGLIWKKKFGQLEKVNSQEKQILNKQMKELYEKIYPQHLELLEGIAMASGLTLNDLDMGYMEYMYFVSLGWQTFKYSEFQNLMHFSKDWQNNTDNCSGASYYMEESGKHFAGRNLDLQYEQPHFIVSHRLDGSYESISNCLSNPFNSTVDGINEKGLFIQEATNGFPQEYNRNQGNHHPGKPAIHNIHLMFIVLQTCATIDEAVELFKKTPIWFSTWVSHYLISDISGRSVVIEYDLNDKPLFYFKNIPYQILTNTAYQRGTYFISHWCDRFRKGAEILKNPVNSPADMMKVMTTMRSTGITKTLWTTIADLSERKIDVYLRTENFSIPHTFVLTYSDNQRNTMTSTVDHDPDENKSIEKLVKTSFEKTDGILLEPYVGKYKFNDFWFANISKEGDHLFIQNTGVKRRKIYTKSDIEFLIPDDNFKITFIKDNAGKVTHFNFITQGIKYIAQKISDQPDHDYKSISKASLIVCGILFSLLIIYFVVKSVVYRFKSIEMKTNFEKNRTRYSRLSKVWICATATIFLFHISILLFLNDLNFLEKLLNFGLYKPGVDEISGCWICLISGAFSVVFLIVSWIRSYWFLFERILMTIVTFTIVYFFIDMCRLGLLTL